MAKLPADEMEAATPLGLIAVDPTVLVAMLLPLMAAVCTAVLANWPVALWKPVLTV